MSTEDIGSFLCNSVGNNKELRWAFEFAKRVAPMLSAIKTTIKPGSFFSRDGCRLGWLDNDGYAYFIEDVSGVMKMEIFNINNGTIVFYVEDKTSHYGEYLSGAISLGIGSDNGLIRFIESQDNEKNSQKTYDCEYYDSVAFSNFNDLGITRGYYRIDTLDSKKLRESGIKPDHEFSMKEKDLARGSIKPEKWIKYLNRKSEKDNRSFSR